MSRRLVSLLLTVLILTTCAVAADERLDRMGEISKRLEELGKQIQACGGSQDCINKFVPEVTALSAEYAQLAKSAAGTQPVDAQKNAPTCAYYFRPGWSCLSVKMTASYRNERKSFETYCDPPGIIPCDRKEFVSLDSAYALTTGGSGILSYTKDFAEFDLFANGDIASTKVTTFQGTKRWRSEISPGSGKYQFEQRNFPLGAVTVDNPASVHIVYPAEQGALTNVFFVPAQSRTGDDWCPIERGDTLSPTILREHVVSVETVTPAMIKAAVESHQLVKAYHWKIMDPDNKGYSDNTLNLTLEIGEPPEEAGALSVSPGDAFSSSGPNDQGLFVPDSKAYTLKNIGKSAISYSVEEAAPWLKLTGSPSGTLAPGQSATVTAEVESAKARVLDQGSYKDTIKFTNTTNAKGSTTRPAELTIGEMQRWKVVVNGWRRAPILPGKTYKDTDGTTKTLVPVVKFNWRLEGEFVLRKRKGKWQYDEGTVTGVKLTPTPDFQPPTLYDCTMVKCVGRAPIDTIVGSPLVGYVTGNSVHLAWPPRQPCACVSCKPKHPNLPKNIYEAEFQDTDFTTQIGLEDHPLTDHTSKPITKKKWLYYTVTLKRLK